MIFFLLLGLSGCITTHEKSISNKTKTHLDLSQNKIKDDVIEYNQYLLISFQVLFLFGIVKFDYQVFIYT